MKEIIRKRLVWVPNLFTLGNLSMGFFAVLLSFSYKEVPEVLTLAGLLIMLAALFDGLDGYMARLLDARSELGAQLDSLADLTTFGIAPGAVMYALVLHDISFSVAGFRSIPVGMLLAPIFPAFAAYRLARFNVSHDPDSFSGLPSPVAGLIVALIAIIFSGSQYIPYFVLIVIYVLAAFLMVSTVKYAKPQVTIFRRFSPARLVIALGFILGVLIFLIVRYNFRYSAAALFTLILIYVISGIVSLIIHTIQEYRM